MTGSRWNRSRVIVGSAQARHFSMLIHADLAPVHTLKCLQSTVLCFDGWRIACSTCASR